MTHPVLVFSVWLCLAANPYRCEEARFVYPAETVTAAHCITVSHQDLELWKKARPIGEWKVVGGSGIMGGGI